MGYTMVNELRHALWPKAGCTQLSLTGNDSYFRTRQVVVVRNWVEAIASGYLYHRSGHECWLDQNGHHNPPGRGNRWLEYDNTWRGGLKKPYANGRSLCQFLNTSTTDEGMRVFGLYALSKWYEPLLHYVQASDPKATMVVCYEGLEPASTLKPQTVERIDKWFRLPQRSVAQGPAHHSYVGAHATSHSAPLRHKLHDLVNALDGSAFGGRVAQGQHFFGCHRQG